MPFTTATPVSRDNLLARIADPVAPQLAETERRLEELIPEQLGGLVPVIYRHVLQAGGKRLRPLLALLSCSAAGGDPNDCVNLAMAVEVLHLSSLIHDDVIDEASERRGRPSVRQQWGNRASILVGDFLVAEVFRRLADDLGRQAIAVLAQRVSEMCRAELSEQGENPAEFTEAQYFDNIRGKTGSLMSAACEVGAIASDNELARPLLATYGLNLGQAFQIVDDLLDLYGDAEKLGKPVLQDLRRGQLTLPIINALASAEPCELERLTNLLHEAQQDPVAARAAADLAEDLGGKQYATDYARRLVEEALTKLFPLPDGTAKAGLQDLAQYVVERQY